MVCNSLFFQMFLVSLLQKVARKWRYDLKTLCMAGCWASSVLMEQWAYSRLDRAESTCNFANHLWALRKEYVWSLESGSPRAYLQCTENVLGDGFWTFRGVWKGIQWKSSRCQRPCGASQASLEKIGRSCCTGRVEHAATAYWVQLSPVQAVLLCVEASQTAWWWFLTLQTEDESLQSLFRASCCFPIIWATQAEGMDIVLSSFDRHKCEGFVYFSYSKTIIF